MWSSFISRFVITHTFCNAKHHCIHRCLFEVFGQAKLESIEFIWNLELLFVDVDLNIGIGENCTQNVFKWVTKRTGVTFSISLSAEAAFDSSFCSFFNFSGFVSFVITIFQQCLSQSQKRLFQMNVRGRIRLHIILCTVFIESSSSKSLLLVGQKDIDNYWDYRVSGNCNETFTNFSIDLIFEKCL